MLPKDGFEVCQQIAPTRNGEVKVVIYRRGRDREMQGVGAGADAPLTKPFSTRIVAQVRKLLGLSEGSSKLALVLAGYMYC
jgi:DNA-binding response OmpR family regulator